MVNDMYDERPRRFERNGGGGGGNGGGLKSFGGPRRSFAPVKEGEELDVTIEAIAAKGDGIAKKQGFVIFVPGTKVGDNVKIRISKVLQKVAFSEIIGRLSGPPAAGSAPQESSEDESSEESADEESDESSEDAPADSEDFGEETEEEQK